MSDQQNLPLKKEMTATKGKISRRTLIGGLATATAAVLLKHSAGQVVQTALPADALLLQDPTKVLGPL
ncbi:MAG TPA: hypothetical protein VM935_00245, partial [Chitinophagaceae bacterium]|nr:hypothetical protein [Chitinophagaceae bacterium]